MRYKVFKRPICVLLVVALLLPSLVIQAGAYGSGYTQQVKTDAVVLNGETSTPSEWKRMNGWCLSVQMTSVAYNPDVSDSDIKAVADGFLRDVINIPQKESTGDYSSTVWVLPSGNLDKYKLQYPYITTPGKGYGDVGIRLAVGEAAKLPHYIESTTNTSLFGSRMDTIVTNLGSALSKYKSGSIPQDPSSITVASLLAGVATRDVVQGLAVFPDNKASCGDTASLASWRKNLMLPQDTFNKYCDSLKSDTKVSADVKQMAVSFATAYAVAKEAGDETVCASIESSWQNYLRSRPFHVPLVAFVPCTASLATNTRYASTNSYQYPNAGGMTAFQYMKLIMNQTPGSVQQNNTSTVDTIVQKYNKNSGTGYHFWGKGKKCPADSVTAGGVALCNAASIIYGDASRIYAHLGEFTGGRAWLSEAEHGANLKYWDTRTIGCTGNKNTAYRTNTGFYYLYCMRGISKISRVQSDFKATTESQVVSVMMGTKNNTEAVMVSEGSDVTANTTWTYDLNTENYLQDWKLRTSEEAAPYTVKNLVTDINTAMRVSSPTHTSAYDAFVSTAASVGASLPSSGDLIETGEYTPWAADSRITFNLYAFVIFNADVDSEKAATVVESNRGYSGDGTSRAPTWAYNYQYGYSCNYNKPVGDWERIARAYDAGPNGVMATKQSVAEEVANAFCAKYPFLSISGSLENGIRMAIEGETAWRSFLEWCADDNCPWELSVTIDTPATVSADPDKAENLTIWSLVGGGVAAYKVPELSKRVTASYTVEEVTMLDIPLSDIGNVDSGAEVGDGGTSTGSSGYISENATKYFEGEMYAVKLRNYATLYADEDAINSGCISFNDLKMDYSPVLAVDPEWPSFHSVMDPHPHSEFNQGTVNAGATSPTRKFNSMTGTPTFTATERSELIDSVENTGYYGKDGHYYQYYAAGGTEFVVEFDGKFYKNQTATRQFTVEVQTSGKCSETNGPCPGESVDHKHSHMEGDPPTEVIDFQGPTHADGCCGAPLHTDPHAHYQHGIWTGSITYPGLSYVEIENVKVYKLSDARLDGTYALLEQNEVFATVQATAPGLSMNIAGSNTAKAGRMVYDWIPDGVTGAGGSDPDHLYWGAKTCTSTCGEDGQDLEDYINQCLSPGHTGAWCLSDFIVIHTSAGTQSVLYHEYHSINDGALLISCSGSSGGPCVGTSEASASVELYQDTEFEVKEYEEVWKSNPWTSEGAGWQQQGGMLTYGGYNGNPMNLSTTYKSTVPATTNINMSWGSWTGTQAYQNKSKVFGARGANSFLQKVEPSKTFRLMNDRLIIPDHKRNGDYDFTVSQVFYEIIASKDSSNPKHVNVYAPEVSSDFNSRSGLTMTAGYSESSPYKTVANSVVVYNPVSNQNAIVISLPDERDQRIDPPDVVQPGLDTGCPGSTCEFSELDCTETTHLHNSGCYTISTTTSHSMNNIHVHKWTDPETGEVFECPKTGGNMCAGQACMATGTHRSAYCPYGHSCNGCSTCHVCQSNGVGGYYITHPSGCTYAGQTHYSTSYPYCTQCGHSCGGSYTLAEHYTCGNLPLNAHQCDGSKFVYLCDGANNKHVHDENCPMTAEKTTTYQNFYYQATGTDLFSFVAPADGTVEFCSTSYTADPRGRIYVNGVCVVDNDDGGNGLNFHATASVRKGDRVVLNAYQYGSAGAGTISGWYKTPGGYECGNTPNYHEHDASCPKRSECFETSVVSFSCTNPHHTWDTDWHVYTTGRMHKDGTVCRGQGCTNMSDIQIRNGVYASVSSLSSGMLVRHSDGQVHLTRQGTTKCDMCGKNFAFYANATQTTRTLTAQEIEDECSHYPMGDARCWKPCGDPAKHGEVRDHVVDMDGNVIVQGDFINLDYGFTIYFPNNGDFYQTGRKSSLVISTERGWGYVNNMDTTEWIRSKWVIFPFDVVFKGISYPSGTQIFLPVPDVYFDFYCVMENNEMASAEVMFGTSAINAIDPYSPNEAKRNESTNKRIISPYSRPHGADKRFFIDVVGRIGALTTNDVGDFRYSNFFKQTIDGWLVPNVIRRVDTSKQLNIVMDDTDIRGIDIDDALIHQGTSESKALGGYSTGSHIGDTYGIREERLRNIWEHPLVPSYLKSSAEGVHGSEPGYYRDDGTFVPTPNNQSALCKQPVRIGYDAYMDFSTIGNYYGRHRTSNGDDLIVRPHYFRLRWDNANAYLTPADVYRLDDGVYTLVNDFDSDGGVPLTNKTQVSLNWVEECARRNYDAVEQRKTEYVHTNYGLDLPRGSQFVYGTYNVMSLWDRNRTSIGTRYTYGVDTDPTDGFEDWIGRYDLQGARWHFNLGLPSSSVFVASGERPTDENIKNFAGEDSQAVIVCALEIYARGDVWNLIYDGKDINSPFKITPGGPEFNPNTWNTPTFKYPGREEDLVIAEIISINHSSKEDVTTSGTH